MSTHTNFKNCVLSCIATKNASDRISNKLRGTSNKVEREAFIRKELNEILSMPNLAEYTVTTSLINNTTGALNNAFKYNPFTKSASKANGNGINANGINANGINANGINANAINANAINAKYNPITKSASNIGGRKTRRKCFRKQKRTRKQ
jgi:hypothetical protein